VSLVKGNKVYGKRIDFLPRDSSFTGMVRNYLRKYM